MKVSDVLSSHFDSRVNQNSPLLVTHSVKLFTDKDGIERSSFVEDVPSDEDLGSMYDWTITSLRNAGINPNFAIHTGNVSRVDGAADIASVQQDVDANFTDVEPENNEE